MHNGIDIDFYEPGEETNITAGILFIDEDGKDYIEYETNLTDLYRSFKIIYAEETGGGEKYTLINCFFRQMQSGRMRFIINELYKGDFIGESLQMDCTEVEARITGLTNWMGNSTIKQHFIPSTGEGKIDIHKAVTLLYDISENSKLELRVFCGWRFERNEIILNNQSSLKFICEKPESRLELYKNLIGFIQLLSIITTKIPKLTNLMFTFTNGRTVEHISTKMPAVNDRNDALLNYQSLENYWPNALRIFYSRRDKFTRVLSLLLASMKNNTSEISFLNITTSFEVFHKYFYEDGNESERKKIASELIALKVIKRDSGRWIQVLRYYHLFKLVQGIDFFKHNYPDLKKTLKQITDSRNYYTHYSPTEKKIWTPNNLVFENHALRLLIKAIVLRELQIPDDLINKLINNRAVGLFQDYENNEYSLGFINKFKDH